VRKNKDRCLLKNLVGKNKRLITPGQKYSVLSMAVLSVFLKTVYIPLTERIKKIIRFEGLFSKKKTFINSHK